ncbi:DUF63 family protein [Natrinema thermotolerans]|uniref:DUF63 family protein n=1 Tax=Natrinema thermotolerans TaxID=121872 RepID=A0AAF0PFE9_9EURY|nr:DUF63 family protein [Natrinema thermotolerans]QCC60579.1 DUF63 family protein [Natrinema thermotolerans]QCC61466.1 DUF63 family protein [Natrinema thermotolerans]WMT07623.1 DUF63 family protein [Natrinema thermotolerans]WMT08255.1 DUF63 family protein [Natrinema thermotolerans]
MDDFIDRFGAERVWAATVATLAVVVALGAVIFPQRVYVEFIWQYFWGPVVADAHSWNCVAWAGGEQVPCTEAATNAGPTAEPGYTFVSYAGYIPTLVLLLIGIIFLVRRLEIERYRAGFFALFPFMLFGGALRVVEDANAAAYEYTGEMAIQLPWSGFIISPLIYFTVFFIALFAVVTSIWLERNDYVSGYEYPLAGIGTAVLTITIAYLAYTAATEPFSEFYPLIPLVVLVGATVATAITWFGLERYAPELNRGTRYMGIVVIWAHAVDGVANVIGLDWATTLGLPANLVPKHPINRAIANTTADVLPADVVSATGSAWPFLLVKLAAAVFVIWIFDETVFEDSPRYAVLLMITVVAVGLGPGTRDMLRATFGV